MLPLDDVVARDFANTLKTEPFIRNSHIDFRKYLGLEDEHVLNSLVTEQPLSAYIPRKDGSFYVNLGDEDNKMLLSNYSKIKGKDYMIQLWEAMGEWEQNMEMGFFILKM